jgi:hypothetical protein
MLSAMTSGEIWWRLLLLRLAQVRLALPADLVGVIQIEIARQDGGALYRYVALDGANTRAGDGIAPEIDAWLELRETDLQSFLEGEGMAPGSARVRGDRRLVEAFLEAMTRVTSAKSVVGIRRTR